MRSMVALMLAICFAFAGAAGAQGGGSCGLACTPGVPIGGWSRPPHPASTAA